MADDGPASAGHKRVLQWPVVLWLTIASVLLWGELSVANVVAGVVIAVIVILIFPLPPIAFTGRIRPLGLMWLVARFLADLLLASGQVAAHVLNFRRQPATSIVAVELRSRADLYLTLTAELVCLVPGSVVVEADRPNWTLHVHALGARTDADEAGARNRALKQEERVIRALGSDAEVEAYNDAKSKEYRS